MRKRTRLCGTAGTTCSAGGEHRFQSVQLKGLVANGGLAFISSFVLLRSSPCSRGRLIEQMEFHIAKSVFLKVSSLILDRMSALDPLLAILTSGSVFRVCRRTRCRAFFPSRPTCATTWTTRSCTRQASKILLRAPLSVLVRVLMRVRSCFPLACARAHSLRWIRRHGWCWCCCWA